MQCPNCGANYLLYGFNQLTLPRRQPLQRRYQPHLRTVNAFSQIVGVWVNIFSRPLGCNRIEPLRSSPSAQNVLIQPLENTQTRLFFFFFANNSAVEWNLRNTHMCMCHARHTSTRIWRDEYRVICYCSYQSVLARPLGVGVMMKSETVCLHLDAMNRYCVNKLVSAVRIRTLAARRDYNQTSTDFCAHAIVDLIGSASSHANVCHILPITPDAFR